MLKEYFILAIDSKDKLLESLEDQPCLRKGNFELFVVVAEDIKSAIKQLSNRTDKRYLTAINPKYIHVEGE